MTDEGTESDQEKGTVQRAIDDRGMCSVVHGVSRRRLGEGWSLAVKFTDLKGYNPRILLASSLVVFD